MRIEEIHVTLASNIEHLVVKMETVDGHALKMTEGLAAVRAARAILRTGVLDDVCNEVLRIEAIALATQEPLVIDPGSGGAFRSAVKTLRARAEIVADALRDFLGPKTANTVEIRLPNTNHLGEVGSVIVDLDKILNQLLVNEHAKGEIRVHRLSAGSMWVEVALGSVAAYQFLGAITEHYFRVRKKQIQLKAQEVQLEELTLEMKHRTAIRSAIEAELERYRDGDLQETLDRFEVPENDNDFRNRVRNIVPLLAQLLDRGVEIHESLVLKDDQRAFPDPKKLIEAVKALPPSSGNEGDV